MITTGSRARMDGQRRGLLIQELARGTVSLVKREQRRAGITL